MLTGADSWFGELHLTKQRADANNDGDSDGADLLVWQQQLGFARPWR
jgi:hypothetical protein